MNFFAYLDPGTGSLIIQAVVGAVLGVGVLVKAFWGRIIGLFGKSKKEVDSDDNLPKDEKLKTSKR